MLWRHYGSHFLIDGFPMLALANTKPFYWILTASSSCLPLLWILWLFCLIMTPQWWHIIVWPLLTRFQACELTWYPTCPAWSHTFHRQQQLPPRYSSDRSYSDHQNWGNMSPSFRARNFNSAGKTDSPYSSPKMEKKSRYAFATIHVHGTIYQETELLTSAGTKIKNSPEILDLLADIWLPWMVAIIHCLWHQRQDTPIACKNALPGKAAREVAPPKSSPTHATQVTLFRFRLEISQEPRSPSISRSLTDHWAPSLSRKPIRPLTWGNQIGQVILPY